MKSRILVFTRADADLFSSDLLDAFPDIRFLPLTEARWVGDDLNGEVPYFSSLGVPETSHFKVWRQPPDWRPEWRLVSRLRGVYIANSPKINFTFYRSSLSKNVYKFSDAKIESLSGSDIFSSYLRDDREHIHFLSQVWRILSKMTTNVLDFDSPKTDECAKAVRTMTWVGPDALRWAARNPNRRLADRYRPLGSVKEARPPRSPEEIYGPALGGMVAEMERQAEEQRKKRAMRRAARRLER